MPDEHHTKDTARRANALTETPQISHIPWVMQTELLDRRGPVKQLYFNHIMCTIVTVTLKGCAYSSV